MSTNNKKSKSNKAKKLLLPIESIVGEKLLSKVNEPLQSTKSLLIDNNKELVGLFFSASWNRPCIKFFENYLLPFYNHVNGSEDKNNKSKSKSSGFEIIFLSSDNDYVDFENYYKQMPWLSLPTTEDGGKSIKAELITKLKIQDIPCLIIIDVKTGKFVSGNAINEITTVIMNNNDSNNNKKDDDTAKSSTTQKKEKCYELINKWKLQIKNNETVPLADGHLIMTKDRSITFVSNFTKMTLFLFVVMYGFKFITFLIKSNTINSSKSSGSGGGSGATSAEL